MTQSDVITSLQAKALSSGCVDAPAGPPESPGMFPFGVTYERSFSFRLESAGFGHVFETYYTEIHVSRVLLAEGITQAQGVKASFLLALLGDPTLGGSVAEVREVRGTFGKLEWGGVETFGYRLEIDTKRQIST